MNKQVIDYRRPATGRITAICSRNQWAWIEWHNGTKSMHSTGALTLRSWGYELCEPRKLLEKAA